MMDVCEQPAFSLKIGPGATLLRSRKTFSFGKAGRQAPTETTYSAFALVTLQRPLSRASSQVPATSALLSWNLHKLGN